MSYRINPLDFSSQIGFGYSDLFNYKSGIEQLLSGQDHDDTDYFDALYKGHNYGEIDFKLSSKGGYQALLGKPIADRYIQFEAKNVLVDDDENQVRDVIVEIELPILKVNRERIIKKSLVWGAKTTIKEYITDGDWKISMSFFVQGKRTMETPYTELEEFFNLLKATTSVEVVSPLLQTMFGVTDVVIDRINNISYMDNYPNIMQVDVDMIADDPDGYQPFENYRR